MQTSYNPNRISNLMDRSNKCIQLMTAATPVDGSPGQSVKPSLEELIYMYDVLGQMVTGLVEMYAEFQGDEDKETAAKPPCVMCNDKKMVLMQDMISKAEFHGPCPRCSGVHFVNYIYSQK